MKKYPICKKLKDLREDRDMNRKEVAERIGIPSQNFNRYENGSTGAIPDKKQSKGIEEKIASLRPENLALLLECIDYLDYKQNKDIE